MVTTMICTTIAIHSRPYSERGNFENKHPFTSYYVKIRFLWVLVSLASVSLRCGKRTGERNFVKSDLVYTFRTYEIVYISKR